MHISAPSSIQSSAAALPPRSATEAVDRNLVRVGEWLVLLASLLYVGGRTLPRAWNTLNTDFPNYYVTARLLREGYTTARAYEWIWFQRQKDRMGIRRDQQPVVGFVPHTPFSALVMWPIADWSAIAAKRVWIVVNLLLLFPLALLLHRLSHLAYRHILLLIALNYPLLRNLTYGQYYLVLLLLLTLSLWCYVRGRRFASGFLMGVAAGLKIFPGLFGLYFVRKRDWHALAGLAVGVLGSIAMSISAFGLPIHRAYLSQVLPWALRGEAMDPYSLSPNSLSSLLHKLFIFEPQWNANPAVHAPLALAILHPLLQMLVLAPAVYLSSPDREDTSRLPLEWSAFLVALLAISTLPASYHFTLLILPAVILLAELLRQQPFTASLILLGLYLAICFPAWPNTSPSGWWALLAVPRLYLTILLCGLCYSVLLNRSNGLKAVRKDRLLWTFGLAAMVLMQMASSIHHQHGQYDRYAQQITMPSDILFATQPVPRGDSLDFVAMRSDGYALGTVGPQGAYLRRDPMDQLSHTSVGPAMWIEDAGPQSNLALMPADGSSQQIEIEGAEFPIASPDGRSLAYLRSDRYGSTLWIHSLSAPSAADLALTRSSFDVEEMTFLPDDSLIFSASESGRPSALYQARRDGLIHSLNLPGARYPAVSPDGRWLAYSKLDRGVFNLWLRDLQAGSSRRLTSADCNDISPAWKSDSKTLIYASDCGRALWFTALYQQRVIP